MNAGRGAAPARERVRTLARLMNRQNELPVPVTGKLLDLLGGCLLPVELDYLIRLGTHSHAYEEARALSGMSEEAFAPFFRRLAGKGFIHLLEAGDGARRYELMPIVVGWLEMQLCHGRETERERAFARDLEGVFRSFGRANFFPARPVGNYLMRRFLKPYQTVGAVRPPEGGSRGKLIQVQREVEAPASRVGPTGEVNELVDRSGRAGAIALMHCFCRQWRRLVGDPCRFEIRPETCVVVGRFAHHIVEFGFGRFITLRDARGILEEVAKAGAVHTLFHERDDTRLPHIAVCNCCWDCCGLWGGYNRGILPLYLRSRWEARLARPDDCKGCGKCEKHCPTNCISVKDGLAVISRERCVGCGQCALQCPTNAVELVPNPRDVMVPLESPSRARIR